MEAFLSRVSVNYNIPLQEITELHELYKLKKGDLVQLCKDKKLPCTGSKLVLLDRLNIIGTPPVKVKKTTEKKKTKPKKLAEKKTVSKKTKPKKPAEKKTKPEEKKSEKKTVSKKSEKKTTPKKSEKKTVSKKKTEKKKKVSENAAKKASETQEYVKNEIKYTEVNCGKTVRLVSEDKYVLDKKTKLVVGKLKGTKVFKLKLPDIEFLLSKNINYDPKYVAKGAINKQAEAKLNVQSD